MKSLFASLFLSLCVCSANAADCDFGAPSSDAPPEFAEYAFLIGNFDINIQGWRNGEWRESGLTAVWNGRYGMGGKAVIDEWFDPGYPDREGSGMGMNVRMYDPEEQVWKMMWQHTRNALVMDLRSELREQDRLYLWQVYPEVPERRVYFEVYGDGHWARIEEKVSEESGEWEPSVKLEATQRTCDAS